MNSSETAFPQLGDICTFAVTNESMALGLPSLEPAGAKLVTFAGEVVKVSPMVPFGPGKIPTAAVTVKGRTGRTVVIDGAACDLRVWKTWDAALKATKEANR